VGRLGVIAVTAAALVCGCGGGDEAEGEGELSAAEYRKQGNALCSKAKAEAEKVPLPRTPDGFADYLKRIFDKGFEANEEFKRLDPPDDLQAAHDASVRQGEEFRKTVDELVANVRKAKDPAQAVQTEIRKLAPELKKSEDLSRKLGLDECLEVGTPSRQPDPS